MGVDESIHVQNRANNGYNQSYIKYQNNNYSQNKWDQTNKFETRNTQQGQAQNKRVPTGTVNQPANKTMRLNNIEENHFFRQNSGVGLPYLLRNDPKINKKQGKTAKYLKKRHLELLYSLMIQLLELLTSSKKI